MGGQIGKRVARGTSRIGDLWGGLAAMLVALPSSVAFGVLVFAAIGPERIAEGALAGAVGAAALGLVAPLAGRTAGLISAPCAPAAAVLSAFVAESLADKGGGAIDPGQLPALLGLTTLLAALLQIVYGAIGGGRLIKFIPYPVVSGYMTGVGTLIALGQLPKLLGLPQGTPLIEGLISPALWKWQGLVVGIVTIAVMMLSPRIARKAPAAILGLAGGILTYFALGIFQNELLTVVGNPLVIGQLHMSGSFADAAAERARSLLSVGTLPLSQIMIPAVTLSVLLSIDTLKTCVVLDAVTGQRHNSNRELVAQGIGNATAFMAGGIPGAGTMGPTLVNVTSGGRTPRSGLFEGGFVVLVLLAASPLLAWLPIGALAGILLAVAWRMVDKNMLRLLRYPAGRLDFAVIAGVVLVAVTWDLIAATGVGVLFAILLFIRAQMQGSVIRRKCTLREVASNTRRLAAERSVLDRDGDAAILCELQGDLFFGTTDKLYSLLEPDLDTARYILLDMRRVHSMDFTAAHLLQQMETRMEDRDGRLLFSGMPSARVDQRDFEHDLARLGVFREDGGAMVSETLDGALEWMEEQILTAAGERIADEEPVLGLSEISLFEGVDETALKDLVRCVEPIRVQAGERIFSCGDSGETIYFVRRGRIQVLLPLEGGKRHHLGTFGPGDFFGEFSFLDKRARSADAEAKTAADLFVLSRTRFDAYTSNSGAALGRAFFARLALAIAERLRQTDAALRVLEER